MQGARVTLTVLAEPCWSVRDVKQRVEAETGIPIPAQALSCGTHRLCDGDLLSTADCKGGRLSLTLHRRNTEQIHWLKLLEGPDAAAKLEQGAPEAIRADFELMLLAAGRNIDNLKHAHQKLLGSREFMLAAARRNPDALAWVTSKALWADRDFVLGALDFSWRWLQSASVELRSDRDFVVRATARNRWALQCASDDLRADADFVALCLDLGRRQYVIDHMRGEGRGLCRARDLRKDPEIVTAAVNSRGAALEYASAELQADRSIVMQAISNDPMALQWAAPVLKGDRKVVVAALEKSDGRALEWVPRELLADKAVSGYANAAKRPPSARPPTASKGQGTVDVRPSYSVALAKARVTELPVGKTMRKLRRPSSAGPAGRRPTSAAAPRARRSSLGGG